MGVQNIEEVRAVFDPENMVQLLPVTETFYQDLDQTFPTFNRHVVPDTGRGHD